jgi:hypothetical protein
MNIQAIFFRILRLIASECEQANLSLFEVAKDQNKIIITFKK